MRGRGCNGSILGAIGGLMMDVYYVNGVLLLLPLLESLAGYRKRPSASTGQERVGRLFVEELGLCGARSSRRFCRR